MEGGWIDPEFELATHVAAECPIVVEIAPAQWHMKPPAPEFR